MVISLGFVLQCRSINTLYKGGELVSWAWNPAFTVTSAAGYLLRLRRELRSEWKESGWRPWLVRISSFMMIAIATRDWFLGCKRTYWSFLSSIPCMWEDPTPILKTYQSQNSTLGGCNCMWSMYHGFEFNFWAWEEIWSVRATALQTHLSTVHVCLHVECCGNSDKSWNSGISVWKGGRTNCKTQQHISCFLTCASAEKNSDPPTRKGVGLGVCPPMTILTFKIKTRSRFDDVKLKHY